jgi:hypothetical protein
MFMRHMDEMRPDLVGCNVRMVIRELKENNVVVILWESIPFWTGCILEDVTRTQKEISEITGVTEVTVRNRYKEIAEYLDLDIDA